MIGRNAELLPGIVSRVQREGHLIASHTYSHMSATDQRCA